MEFIRNFPCFSLILSMGAAIISSALSSKAARRLNMIVMTVVMVLSAGTLYFTMVTNRSYVYKMGRFGAPWGNEIRFGSLEAMMAFFFSIIMILSLVAVVNICIGKSAVLKKIYIIFSSIF